RTRAGVLICFSVATGRRSVADPSLRDSGHFDGRPVYGRSVQVTARSSHQLPSPSWTNGCPHTRGILWFRMGTVYRSDHLGSSVVVLCWVSKSDTRRRFRIRILSRPGLAVHPYRIGI